MVDIYGRKNMYDYILRVELNLIKVLIFMK